MPTYRYRCEKCGQMFEHVEHLSEHAGTHVCPKCGSKTVQPVPAQFYARTPKKS